MIYNGGNKNKFGLLCMVIMLCIILTSLNGCSGLSKFKGMSAADFIYTGKGKQYHSFSRTFSKVTESAGKQLYFDEKSMSTAVYDTSGGCGYYSLPCSESTASVLSLTVVGETGTYLLNSQDNSVAFGSATYNLTDGGVRVSYIMSNDAKTVKKNPDELIYGEVYVSLTVTYTLTAGNLYVGVSCPEIFVSNGYRLTQLTLLGYFGAIYGNSADFIAESVETTSAAAKDESTPVTTGKAVETTGKAEKTAARANPAETLQNKVSKPEDNRDFLLVPDGCGALMYTDTSDGTTDRVSFKVYGDDAGAGESGGMSACFPAFGIKHGAGAFTAVIRGGDECARITAEKAFAEGSDGANRVFPSFDITPVQKTGGKSYFGKSYSGNIMLCYSFLSGSEATYTGMAGVCREEFMRTGVLGGTQLRENENGLNISVIVSSDGKKKGMFSTFSQAEDTLALLKAKGTDSVNLILKGAVSGGLVQEDTDRLDLMRAAGGKSGYASLYSYAQKQKFNVYLGSGLITQASAHAKVARSADGSSIAAEISNPLYPYYGTKFLKASLISVSQIENNTVKLINSTNSSPFDGYCITDAGNILYSDSSGQEVHRDDTALVLSKCMSSLSAQKKLMLEGCNFNVIGKADILTDIPFGTQNTETDAYVAVPFLQSMLHSTVCYSGSPINKAPIPTLLMLKYVEYGASLYFEWTIDKTDSPLYYDNSISDAAEWYNAVQNKLSDLSDDRIISHGSVAENVYCTGYDCGTLVYVNYNNYSVNIGKISVPAYGFFRVN